MRRIEIGIICTAFYFLGLFAAHPRILDAGYSSITQCDFFNIIHAQTIAPSGTYTQLVSFRALQLTNTQSMQIQATGTSPNYSVQMLVSLDHVNFAVPQLGGTIGTFTDSNLHIIALALPLHVESKLLITELGGVNSVTIEASELSQ
jgi:hypothetical protein